MYSFPTIDELKGTILENSKEYINKDIAENDEYHKKQKGKVKTQFSEYSTEAIKDAHSAYQENEIDFLVTAERLI